jgi:hypothetical protein
MRIAIEDLRLDHLTVLYPGSRTYALADRVRIVALAALATGDPAVILPPRSRIRRPGTAGEGVRRADGGPGERASGESVVATPRAGSA